MMDCVSDASARRSRTKRKRDRSSLHGSKEQRKGKSEKGKRKSKSKSKRKHNRSAPRPVTEDDLPSLPQLIQSINDASHSSDSNSNENSSDNANAESSLETFAKQSLTPQLLEELRFTVGLEKAIVPSFTTVDGPSFLVWMLRQQQGEGIPAFLMEWNPTFLRKWLREHPAILATLIDKTTLQISTVTGAVLLAAIDNAQEYFGKHTEVIMGELYQTFDKARDETTAVAFSRALSAAETDAFSPRAASQTLIGGELDGDYKGDVADDGMSCGALW